MITSGYKAILKEETAAALGVSLGAVIGLLVDNYIIGIFSAAGFLLITRAVTFVRIKNLNKLR